MKRLLEYVGSMHVAIAGLLGLLVVLLMDTLGGGSPNGSFAAILAALSVNLTAAVIVRPQFRRQPALLAFHVCLAMMAGLLAMQSLTRFEGRIELAENQAFDPAGVVVDSTGPWHKDELSRVRFVQGPVSIEYHPNLRRGKTRSLVYSEPESRHVRRLGDTQPMETSGYRFAVTPNKGFALTLTWFGQDGSQQTGNIHFPSFPAQEWNQTQVWSTPSGDTIELFLEQAPVPMSRNWTLSRQAFRGRVWLTDGSRNRRELTDGSLMEIKGGTVRLDDVVMWIGYRIEKNLALPWIFAAALMGTVALGWHFIRRPERYGKVGRTAHAH